MDIYQTKHRHLRDGNGCHNRRLLVSPLRVSVSWPQYSLVVCHGAIPPDVRKEVKDGRHMSDAYCAVKKAIWTQLHESDYKILV